MGLFTTCSKLQSDAFHYALGCGSGLAFLTWWECPQPGGNGNGQGSSSWPSVWVAVQLVGNLWSKQWCIQRSHIAHYVDTCWYSLWLAQSTSRQEQDGLMLHMLQLNSQALSSYYLQTVKTQLHNHAEPFWLLQLGDAIPLNFSKTGVQWVANSGMGFGNFRTRTRGLRSVHDAGSNYLFLHLICNPSLVIVDM